MDINQRTSGALLDRANADVAQLLRRFENIIAYNADERHDRVSAAVGVYQMEVETAALIKAAEDILSLTRTLKEAWLFGKIQNIGTSEAESRAQAATLKAAEDLRRLDRTGSHDLEMTTGETNGEGNGEDVNGGDGSGNVQGGDEDTQSIEQIAEL